MSMPLRLVSIFTLSKHTVMRLRSHAALVSDAYLDDDLVNGVDSKTVDSVKQKIKVEFGQEVPTQHPGHRRKIDDNAVTVKIELTPTKKAKKKIAMKTERVIRQEPSNWRELFQGIEQMRAKKDAEVDKFGCESFSTERFPPHVNRFHVLISAMLSSQTKDPVNAAAMTRLIKYGLTVESMLEIDQEKLARLIRPVGFFNLKAKYIKQTASLLLKQAETEGLKLVDIPNSYEALIALPGVGPKMATLAMTYAWGNTMGICVDTHVHRISNRLQWVKTWNMKNHKSQDPEKTRAELEDWLPKEYWGPINPLLVGFGQSICLPRRPKCNECLIRGMCPSANSSAI
ncbi:hypothetical protein CCR75_003811 [Bremia lactucae]|uniref:Endonuclease III homolog n=1 Tax=Bremia lactucae TaxID=4779 RepID=A0A976IDH4_BRELC|nr:hypothetical protein CCR75_003811 [Bremia lactucae]